ncbi:MAG: hypothetical protein ACYC99_10460 [Candidatus Geothermincolia bacterium]
MTMKCPSCGAENPDHADYCNLCMSTVGFECAEYTTPAARDEGFQSKYPSSFNDDAPVQHPDAFTRQPTANPVDIGKYGARSGETVPDFAPEAGGGTAPVDIGSYGAQSGHEPHEPPPLEKDYGDGGRGKRHRKRRR